MTTLMAVQVYLLVFHNLFYYRWTLRFWGQGAAIANKAAVNVLTGVYPQEMELLAHRVVTF